MKFTMAFFFMFFVLNTQAMIDTTNMEENQFYEFSSEPSLAEVLESEELVLLDQEESETLQEKNMSEQSEPILLAHHSRTQCRTRDGSCLKRSDYYQGQACRCAFREFNRRGYYYSYSSKGYISKTKLRHKSRGNRRNGNSGGYYRRRY